MRCQPRGQRDAPRAGLGQRRGSSHLVSGQQAESLHLPSTRNLTLSLGGLLGQFGSPVSPLYRFEAGIRRRRGLHRGTARRAFHLIAGREPGTGSQSLPCSQPPRSTVFDPVVPRCATRWLGLAPSDVNVLTHADLTAARPALPSRSRGDPAWRVERLPRLGRPERHEPRGRAPRHGQGSKRRQDLRLC